MFVPVWNAGSIWRYQLLRSLSGTIGRFWGWCTSFALYCLNRLSVVIKTSSGGWQSFVSFKFFSTIVTSCSTLMRQFALISSIEYDVLFPWIFVKYMVLCFGEDGSALATNLSHSSVIAPSFEGSVPRSQFHCPFAQRISVLHRWPPRNMLSSGVWRWVFTANLSSSLERNLVSLLIQSAMWVVYKLNWGS